MPKKLTVLKAKPSLKTTKATPKAKEAGRVSAKAPAKKKPFNYAHKFK